MKNNNHIKLLIAFSIIILIAGCNKKEPSNINENNEISYIEKNEIVENVEIPKIYKEYDNNSDFDSILNSIAEETTLTKETELSEDEAKELYNLKEYKDVKVIVRKNNEREIAIIKVPNTDDSVKVISKASERTQKLDKEILSDDTKFVMEQNDGIITIVIGNDARKISEEIKLGFLPQDLENYNNN